MTQRLQTFVVADFEDAAEHAAGRPGPALYVQRIAPKCWRAELWDGGRHVSTAVGRRSVDDAIAKARMHLASMPPVVASAGDSWRDGPTEPLRPLN